MLVIPFCGYQDFESWCEYSFGGEMPNSRTAYKTRVEGYGLIVGGWLGVVYEDIHYDSHMIVFGGDDHGIWQGSTDLRPHNVCQRWMRDINGSVLVQDGKRWIQYEYLPDPLESSMINCDCLNSICLDVYESYRLDYLRVKNLTNTLRIRAEYTNFKPWDIEGIYRDSIKYYNGTPPEYPWEKFVITSRPINYD